MVNLHSQLFWSDTSHADATDARGRRTRKMRVLRAHLVSGALCTHCYESMQRQAPSTSCAQRRPSRYDVRSHASVRRTPSRPAFRRGCTCVRACAGHDAMWRRGAPLALALALALCGAAHARPQCRLIVIGAGTPRTGSTHEMKVRRVRRDCARPAA